MARRAVHWMFVAGVAASALLLWWILHLQRCHRGCAEALARGEALAEEGQPLAALRLLDDVDASCDCMRFTEGDEPPEHSSARVWLQSLEAGEGRVALDALIPRGPVLKMLLRDRDARAR